MTTPANEMDPVGPYRRHPLAPHQLIADLTPTEDAIVLAHLGVPRLDAERWTLRVDGLVRQPRTLSLPDLLALPTREITSFHECAGSPLEPTVPQRRIVNVVWGGVPLRAVLDAVGVDPAARYVWSYGADHGTFADVEVDAYVKDLPLDRVADDVLLAHRINHRPLPAEHGYPLRLVVPGWYGTNSVKWLTRLRLADRRAPGPFTTRFYTDPDPRRPGATRPVWEVAPESVIVHPAPDAEIGDEVSVWGRAWGGAEIVDVEVSTDGGRRWRHADVEPRREWSWQRFTLPWRPGRPGRTTLVARARDAAGAVQPMTGARNAVHRVPVTVIIS
jgi:DMSO/TMAO reductase YedYZ molybdopterin-dependent catalytic subunit